MNYPIEQLEQIMAKLRDPEGGCPWALKQNFETIVPHTIEETYEVVDAINNKDWLNLQEELGDLLFQVIFYSQLAKEQGLFDFSDVVDGINEKLTRRHPHVFSNTELVSDDEINASWEVEKAKERAQTGKTQESILDSIPSSLPALSRATKIQKQVAKYGFDWDSIGLVADKVLEEVDEVLEEALKEAPNEGLVEEELGDLLFATVNLVRHLGKNPESALSKANLKFSRRFKGIELKVRQQNKNLTDFSLQQLDSMWGEVKVAEKK